MNGGMNVIILGLTEVVDLGTESHRKIAIVFLGRAYQQRYKKQLYNLITQHSIKLGKMIEN